MSFFVCLKKCNKWYKQFVKNDTSKYGKHALQKPFVKLEDIYMSEKKEIIIFLAIFLKPKMQVFFGKPALNCFKALKATASMELDHAIWSMFLA